MYKLAQAHPSEEVLEEYALGRLTGPELEQFEEHLLVCAQCQDGLAETDEFIVTMKQATAGIAPRPERKWFDRFNLSSEAGLGGGAGRGGPGSGGVDAAATGGRL